MAAAVEMRRSLANKIESEILRAKEDLQGVDDNLRRLTGRDFNGVGRSESHRFSESDASGPRNTQPPAKRQSLGGIGVFARLGDVVECSPDVGSRMNGSAQRGRSGVLRRDSRDGPPQRGDFDGYGSDHEGGRPPGGDRRRGGGGRGDHISFRSPPRRDGGMAFGGRGGRRAMEEDGGFRGGRGGGVGSRVYGGGRWRGDAKSAAAQEEELEGPQLSSPKPAVASSVARATVDTSRVEAAAVVTSDRASRDRNRRMFGALLGTLQSFKKDEAKQRDKEEQRLAVEKKLEQKGIEEQERLRQEKRRLWEERRTKQMHIRRLAEHAERVKEHEQWAEQQLRLTHFIRTKASPPVFWLPRTLTRAADKLKQATAEDIQSEVSKRREQLEEELQQLLRKTERSGKEQPDYLDFGGDEGDDLDYDGGDAGGELVWPSGRGKVGMDGEARDSSRDARHGRDGRSKDVSVGKVRRGREGETTPEVPAGVSGRRRDSDDADLTSTGKDVLLSGRMVVQVGGASGGERSVGGVRRVVEVIEEDACKKRKGGDASASKSARLKLLAADMRDITIKVERGMDGSEEKENRKIVVEKTPDKGDKGKDKNKKKSKSDKIKDVDNAENDLEDEVTRMRKRIVEKARKMENEEKEKNLKKINGDMKGVRKNAESESSDKTKENAKSSLGLSKTENKKQKEDGGSVNVKAAKDKPTAEELEAIKDITEGVASCEESCEEDEVEGKKKDLTDERNTADSSVDAEQQAEVATAPPVVTDPLVCAPAVSAAADDANSMKQNMGMQEQLEEDEKKDSVEAVLTMELQSFENFDDDGASQGELAGDALQLTVDPMEKAMMEADVEGLDSLEPESKSSRSREKHISGSASSSRSTSKTSRSTIRSSGVDYKNGKYDVKSKDANKTSANKHDRNIKVDVKSKCDQDYSKPGFSSDASQFKVIKPSGASSSSGKFGVKVAKLDESLSKTVANVSETDVSLVMRVDASSVSKNGQSDAKSEDAGKQFDSAKTKEKQSHPSGGTKKSLSNNHKHDKVSRPDDKVTESAKDKHDRKKTEPLGAFRAKLSDGKLPKSDTRKTEKTAAQQKLVVQTAVKDVTEATSVEKSSKHEKSSKKINVGVTSKYFEEVKLTSKSGDAIRREENRANITLKSTEVCKKVDEKRREPEIKKKTQSDQKAVDQKETGKVLLKSKSVSKSESGKDKLTKESEKVYREPTDKKKDDIKTSEKKKLYKSEIDSEIRSKKIDRDNQDEIDDFEHTAVTSGDKRSTDTRKRKVPSEDVEEESRSDKKKTRRESHKKRQEGLKKSSTDKTRRTDEAKYRSYDSESSSDDSDDSSSSDDSDDSRSSQSGDDSSSSDDSSDSSSNSSSDSGSGSESEDQNIRQKQIKRSNVSSSSSSSKNRNIRDKRRSASDSDLDDNEDEEEEDNKMRNPPTKKGGSSKSADAGEKNSRGKLVVKTKTIKKNMVEDERERKDRESEKSRDGRSKEATAKRRRSRSREDRIHESRKVSKK